MPNSCGATQTRCDTVTTASHKDSRDNVESARRVSSPFSAHPSPLARSFPSSIFQIIQKDSIMLEARLDQASTLKRLLDGMCPILTEIRVKSGACR